MLFNSFAFLLAFLPATCLVFWLIGARSRVGAIAWLTLASLVFYAWWDPIYVALLVMSIVFNHLVGSAIHHCRATGAILASTAWLVAGVTGDLLVLGYFKYAVFFIRSIIDVSGAAWSVPSIILPLGISFFTFTQIAFLVDTWRGQTRSLEPARYALFVSYFPHLIAGPILNYRETAPQFAAPHLGRVDLDAVATGLTIFVVGLFKKVILADAIARYANPVFTAAAQGTTLSLLEAWGGALAYTLQIYFDFSAYSDMAIGLSTVFGVRIPLNFNSPYKAESIADFWRRWHISLSRFLRDYLYIPLGGNRYGKTRRYLNLMITMLLGGLWHGASWTFVVWGGLHGCYLVINHCWHWLRGPCRPMPSAPARFSARALTFFSVVVAWVIFRAESFESARRILAAMFGFNGVVLFDRWRSGMGATGDWLAAHHIGFSPMPLFAGLPQIQLTLFLLAIVWLSPNTRQLFERYDVAIGEYSALRGVFRFFAWRPSLISAGATAALLTYCLITMRGSPSTEFIYYNF
ncbi:MAG TPA: MBOAT family protein [Stellaceae bacterium]|jgi:D-alanyl-lipoteichoic acid acyltransferase DltB (MBOAT superfamily)